MKSNSSCEWYCHPGPKEDKDKICWEKCRNLERDIRNSIVVELLLWDWSINIQRQKRWFGRRKK